MADSVIVDGVRYVRDVERPSGTRRIFVVDRGWIVAGDVVSETADTVTIDRVVHVQRWSDVWFSGMVANPDSSNVTLAKMPERLELYARAILFRVQVSDDWGMRCQRN